jgi:hypothetical protein
LGIASIATTLAQSSNVYSVNVVGYVTVTVDNDTNYRILSNPLMSDSASLTTLIPAPVDGTQVSKLVDGVYQTATYVGFLGGWDQDLSFAAGEGFFIKLGAGGAPVDITFVGEVAQNEDSNKSLPPGLSLQGSLVPQSGSMVSVLGIPGEDGDQVSKLPANGVYQTATFVGFLGGWDQDLSFDVAEGFFFFNPTQNPRDWTRDFVVE